MTLPIIVICAIYGLGILTGMIIILFFDKEARKNVNILSLFFLTGASVLATYLLLENRDVPIFVQLLILGLSAEVLQLNLAETIGLADKIHNLKNNLFKKDDQ